LDYRRNLFEAIFELSDQEEEKAKLFESGKPVPALSSFLTKKPLEKDKEHEM
jgi:hypothetical protein